jgi:hypothetical protein
MSRPKNTLPPLTIYDIKRKVEEADPENKYFSKGALKFFGQIMADYSVKRVGSEYYICAPITIDGRVCGLSERWFDPETKELKSSQRTR